MAGNTKMREEMVREFIKCLSEETIPWHMAWSTDRPVNAVTNTRYRGIQDVAVIHPENGRMGRSKMVHL